MAKNKKVQARKGKKPTAKRIIQKAPPVVEAPRKENPRRAIFAVSPQAFMSLFSGRHAFEVVKNPIPPDAKVIDSRLDLWSNGGNGAIEILLEHKSIPELVEGQPIPYLAPPVFQNVPMSGGDTIAQEGFKNSVVKK